MTGTNRSRQASRYHAYLLRLWAAADEKTAVWHASLENPLTGERLGFASLERLFAFLQDQTAILGDVPPIAPDDDTEQRSGTCTNYNTSCPR